MTHSWSVWKTGGQYDDRDPEIGMGHDLETVSHSGVKILIQKGLTDTIPPTFDGERSSDVINEPMNGLMPVVECSMKV